MDVFSSAARTRTRRNVESISTRPMRADRCEIDVNSTDKYRFSLPRSSCTSRLQAIAPYDPSYNSSAVYLAETNEILAATVSDFAGNDPLIYRKKLSDGGIDLRTQRDDLRVLDCTHSTCLPDSKTAFQRRNSCPHLNPAITCISGIASTRPRRRTATASRCTRVSPACARKTAAAHDPQPRDGLPS